MTRVCTCLPFAALYALSLVNAALDSEDPQELLKVLQMPHLGLRDVKSDNALFYMQRVSETRDFKKVSASLLWMEFVPSHYEYQLGLPKWSKNSHSLTHSLAICMCYISRTYKYTTIWGTGSVGRNEDIVPLSMCSVTNHKRYFAMLTEPIIHMA